MRVPTSEVSYTIATTRRENTKVHKHMWCDWRGGGGILFIIIIAGMLVIFIYITRLASNEIFSPSKKILIFIY